MEYIFLIVIIVILIMQNTKYTKDSINLKRDVHSLNEKVNGLYKLLRSKEVPKTVEKDIPKVVRYEKRH